MFIIQKAISIGLPDLQALTFSIFIIFRHNVWKVGETADRAVSPSSHDFVSPRLTLDL